MNDNILVIGGGIAGIMSALLLRKKFMRAKITLIESTNALGGLLKSFHYSGIGDFDHGTHYLTETGIREIDEIMLRALPEHERHTMTGYATDISGIYYRGRLQHNTPFPDLRNHPERPKYIAELFDQISKHGSSTSADEHCAESFFEARFGKSITHEIIAPILQKLFRTPLCDLSPLGSRFVPLTRIGLFDPSLMLDLIDTEHTSKVLAFTEQRNLPIHRQPTFKAFYPKTPGIGSFTKGLISQLIDNAIEIRTETSITNISISKSKIQTVTLKSKTTPESYSKSYDLIINAAGLLSSAKILSLEKEKISEMDKPLATAIVHFILPSPIESGGLYYFYCYDAGYKIFRVTDYHNYCPHAKKEANGYPVTIEMLFDSKPPEKSEIVELALEELKRMGLCSPSTAPTFSSAEVLGYGFPLLTKRNVEIIDSTRKALLSLNLGNYVQCGALSEPGIYFQREVIFDVHRKISCIQ